MARIPDKDNLPPASEEQLEHYLDGDSQLSQAYRDAEQPEPPPALDRAILEQARAEVKAPLIAAGSFSFWQQWLRPATIVLTMGACLAIVLEVMNTTSTVPGMTELDRVLTEDRTAKENKRLTTTLPATSSPNYAAEITTDRTTKSASLAADARARKTAMPPPRVAQPGMRFNDTDLAEDEITATARKREESLQEVPMSVTALAENDLKNLADSTAKHLEEIVIAKDESFANNALEAWNKGARPSANVWLAGIQAMIEDDEADFAGEELERMALVYPNVASQFREANLLALNDASAKSGLNMLAEITVTARKGEQPTPSADIANAWVWFEGIQWLKETGATEEAEAEVEKFRQIYPDF